MLYAVLVFEHVGEEVEDWVAKRLELSLEEAETEVGLLLRYGYKEERILLIEYRPMYIGHLNRG